MVVVFLGGGGWEDSDLGLLMGILTLDLELKYLKNAAPLELELLMEDSRVWKSRRKQECCRLVHTVVSAFHADNL